MPNSLETPVLQVDVHVIHKVDTSNPENLYSMWTVFARCADSVQQGRRLENLSWRLWNRETFCCKDGEGSLAPSTTVLPRDIQRPTKRSSSDSLPPLSGSVDSAVDEEAVEFVSDPSSFDVVRPRIHRQDSCASSRSRGQERHISSDHLEKMVVSIIEAKELPFKATHANSQPPAAPVPEVARPPCSPPALHRSGSTSTESLCETFGSPSLESLPPMATQETRTTVVRGFSPSSYTSPSVSMPVSKPSKTSLTSKPSAIPAPTDTPAAKTVPFKKQPAIFLVGGSSASGDDCPSEHGSDGSKLRTVTMAPGKKSVFQIGGSSDDERSSLKNAMQASRQGAYLMPPKPSCSSRPQAAKAFQSLRMPTETYQSETDYIDESAIDDDDDEDEWEDSVEESGKSSVEEKINFKRVDSKINLTSRRSLITLMLAQNERHGSTASNSTSAIPRSRSMLSGPSLVASPNDSDDNNLMMKRTLRNPALRPITEVPRTMAQPIVTPAIGIQNNAALSPRTTRRNMLATELTESLRRNLLWERSQKSQVAKAMLKRRHTSHDVSNLKQFPQRSCMKKENDVNASSWDDYFNKESFTGYHAQGW